MRNRKINLISFTFIATGAAVSTAALATNCTNFTVISDMFDNNCAKEAAGSCPINYIKNDQ